MTKAIKKVSAHVSDFPFPKAAEPEVLHIHASCVAIDSHGVLLLGESGTGKSDLALRLIDRGAKLVSDDRVNLTKSGGEIIASSPANIAGLIEVRGVGIFRMKEQGNIALCMVIQLAGKESIERLPYPEFYDCMGIKIPQVRLCPFESSSPVKVEIAVAALYDGSMTVGALSNDPAAYRKS